MTQLKKPTAEQELERQELALEVDAAVESYEDLCEEIEEIIGSPYNIGLDGEEGGTLAEGLEDWLPEFHTFFRKLRMIPERAKSSVASLRRLKRQLRLWNETLEDELDEHMDELRETYKEREETDTEVTQDERDDLGDITAADERYFQWYLKQSRPALDVYRGDGRNVDAQFFDGFTFDDIWPGGTRDISFYGVVEHTHTSTRKNGMISTTSDRNQAYHWAIDDHNHGVVYELRVNTYIDVAALLAARNFKNRFAAQLEILVPDKVPAAEVRRVVLYSKAGEIDRRNNT